MFQLHSAYKNWYRIWYQVYYDLLLNMCVCIYIYYTALPPSSKVPANGLIL